MLKSDVVDRIGLVAPKESMLLSVDNLNNHRKGAEISGQFVNVKSYSMTLIFLNLFQYSFDVENLTN